jgi:hypothetical protein
MKVIFALLLLIPYSVGATDIVLNPKPQLNKDTCQSYQIAFGLSYTGAQEYAVSTTKQLRGQERAFRAVLTQVANEAAGALKGDTTAHQNWQVAVRRLTKGKYVLRDAFFKTMPEFYAKISSITGNENANSGGAALAAFTAKQPVFTSVTRVGANSYLNGHIVAVFGYQKPALLTPGPQMKLPLAILNSAIKVGNISSNMCSADPGDNKYRAEVYVEGNYELKSFEPLGYNLLWIDRAQ